MKVELVSGEVHQVDDRVSQWAEGLSTFKATLRRREYN